MQQYRMIKGRVTPPKLLFLVANQIEKILIEQSANLVLAFTNTIQLYNWLIICLGIGIHDVYIVEVYNVNDVTVK